MDNPICVSCHKGLSLEEIERGQFKQLGGRLYCAECVAKMRRVGPTPCPECGTTDTPLYTGTGYLCRKCGADLQPGPAAAAPQARPKRPGKRCPFCGATIPAEALKCRYCTSSLTREARDLEDSGRQNSQLRFWLGCLASATLFLLIFLIYALASRRSEPVAAPPAAAAPATAAAAKPDASAALFRELGEELRSVRGQLATLRAEQERLVAAARQPAVPTPPTYMRVPKSVGEALKPPAVVPKAETPQPKATEPVAPKQETPTPPATPKAETPAPKSIPPPTATEVKTTPPPPPTPSVKETAPPSKAEAPKVEAPKVDTKQAEQKAAQLAAAAYPAFAAELDKQKAARRYGDALSACRQFLANHLGTPEAEKAQAAQKTLRDELDRIRDGHARRFKEAIGKGDLEAARRIAAELAQFDAPETREDRDRMLADVKAAEQKPAVDVAKYLGQWEVPPNVARLIQELKTEKDWTARSRAAKEIGRVGHRAGVAALIEALGDQEWYVKASAIGALVDIGDPIALPHLAPLAKASFPTIYDPAARACRALAAASREKFPDAWKLIDPKAVAAELADALKVQDKEDSPVTSRYQIALIDTLALLDAKDAAPAIRPLFDKAKDPAVRKAAADAIQKLTGEKLMPEPAPPPKAEPPKEAPKAEPPKKAETPPAKAPEPAPKAPAPPAK